MAEEARKKMNRFGNLSLGTAGRLRETAVFEFTSSLHPDWTYQRNDTGATYRGSDGKLKAVSVVNEPRFHHTAAGKALGLKLHQPTSTNKCTNFNVNPTDLTNVTVSGTGATLEIADDTAQLLSAGLDKICTNGKVYKLTGGSATAICTFTGQFGNTNAHSYSIWARGVGVSTTGQLRRSGAGSPAVSVNSGGGYVRYTIDNDTPSSSSNELRITAFAGEENYFVLNQAEEQTAFTDEIVIAGATGARAADRLFLNSPNGKAYFNETRGFVAVSFRVAAKTRADTRYAILASDGTTGDTIGIRVGPENEIRGSVKASGASKHVVQNQDEVPVDSSRLLLHSAAVSWKSGEAFIASSGTKNTQTYSGDPSGITEIDVLARNGGNDGLEGYVTSVSIGTIFISELTLGNHLARDFDKVIHYSGQSIAVGLFVSQDTGDGGGRRAILDEWADAQPSLDVLVTEGATGGAALLSTSSPSPATNYYVDPDTGLFDGDAWDDLNTALALTGNKGDLFVWDQGEQDSHQLNATTPEPTKATYKTQLKGLFDKVRTIIGAKDCLIIPIGRRSGGFTNTGGMQLVREAQREVSSENAYVFQGPEKYDLALLDETGATDTVHLADASYVSLGGRVGRKALDMLGFTTAGVDGPLVASASRSGTAVTVNLTHDDGSDFTIGATGTQFHFFDDGVEISITTAVRTDATTVTLTLASTPTGTEILRVVQDDDQSITPANLLVDDATDALTLRNAEIAL